MDFTHTLIELAKGASFLLAIAYTLSWRQKMLGQGVFRDDLLAGVVIGLATVIGMMTPFTLTEGVIFDGRSILIGVGSAIGGPVVAIAASIPALLFRVYMGGGRSYFWHWCHYVFSATWH